MVTGSIWRITPVPAPVFGINCLLLVGMDLSEINIMKG